MSSVPAGTYSPFVNNLTEGAMGWTTETAGQVINSGLKKGK